MYETVNAADVVAFRIADDPEAPILFGIPGGTWNGWEVPLVTAEDFADFIQRFGAWAGVEANVVEEGHVIVATIGRDSEVWAHVNGLYSLDGWMWVRA